MFFFVNKLTVTEQWHIFTSTSCSSLGPLLMYDLRMCVFCFLGTDCLFSNPVSCLERPLLLMSDRTQGPITKPVEIPPPFPQLCVLDEQVILGKFDFFFFFFYIITYLINGHLFV